MSKLWNMLVVHLLFGAVLFIGLIIIAHLTYLRQPMWTGCSPVNACIANMKQFDGAKATWVLENGKQTNDVPSWSDIVGETKYIRHMYTCPSGGTYALGPVGTPPSCSVPGHVLP